MGHIAGHDQKQVYVEEGLWAFIVLLARKAGVPTYKIVNQALRMKVARHFSRREIASLQRLLSQRTKGPVRAKRKVK